MAPRAVYRGSPGPAAGRRRARDARRHCAARPAEGVVCLLSSGQPRERSGHPGARARFPPRISRSRRHVPPYRARRVDGAAEAAMTLGPLMIDLEGTSVSAEEREMLRHPLVGGVILFTRNYSDRAQLSALVAQIHAARSPPLIVAVDHEGGRVQRFRAGFSALPPPRRIGHEYDANARAGLEFARSMGWLMAAELRAHGVDVSFAPCVDIDYGVSFITDRAFHGTPDGVAALAAAYARGMRDAGMAATAKHFPGHGAVVADSHLTLPVDRRELADLTGDLAPYRRLIANGLPAVM